MRRTGLTVLAIGWVLAACAPEPAAPEASAAAEAPANPLLWRIEGDRSSWLFGTIHLPDPRVVTLAPEVEGYHGVLKEDFEEAESLILSVTGQESLLDYSEVIKNSIRLRNPFTDVLNLMQIDLIRRYRTLDEEDRDSIRSALFLSINGIAAAMQSTG